MIRTRVFRLAGVLFIALAGVVGVGATATASPAAVPSTSPVITPHAPAACPSGDVCAIVVSSGKQYQFNFRQYGSYSLSHWTGNGGFENNQTGGATVRLINVSGGRIECQAPEHNELEVNWNPVWRIDLSASNC